MFAHLNDTFYVLGPKHAEVAPDEHSFWWKDDRACHLHGAFLIHDFEHFYVITVGGLRYLISLTFLVVKN